jgi:ceramide glucosyltransferase
MQTGGRIRIKGADMTGTVVHWLGLLLLALAAAGCVYQLAALAMLRAFFRRRPVCVSRTEGASLLKPLHGPEPRLTQNLASFLSQDYEGAQQMVCGLSDAADPAAAAVEQLRREHPVRDIELVVRPAPPCANGKVGNLVNMLPAARHDLLVLSDSDMAVGPDYLGIVLGALGQPGIGAVTCLYRGRGDAGFWSRLSAGAISWSALPQMVVGHVTGLARPCMGSTIALRRETLDAIGGFERFADVLADDHAIGAAVTDTGLRIAIPPLLLIHGCGEASLAELWRQKLRWAATIRGVAALGHAGSVITYPLPLALLALPLAPYPAVCLVIVSFGIRLIVAVNVERIAGERSAPLWLLPAIDCIDLLVFIASFFAQTIDWRGNRITMERHGRITV